MAKFVVLNVDGKNQPFLEGGDGDELTAEMVSAYSQLAVASALHEIANRLVGIDNSINAIASALER